MDLGSLDHRVRSSGVGAGRHGGYIGRFEEKKSRRSGPASGGGHIDNDRDRRGDHLTYHLPHGIKQSARSVDLDQNGICMLRCAFIQPPRHVVGADGLDGVVEVDDDHAWLLRPACKGPAAGQYQHTQQAVHGTG
jgi:hypothetical protein